jgi:hypothetical protein
MASHTKDELRDAARVLGRAALQVGFRPAASVPMAATHGLEAHGAAPAEPREREPAAALFDGQAPIEIRRAA